MCAPQAPRASCEAIVSCITANPSDSDPSGAEVKHVRTDRPDTTLPTHDQAEHELTLFQEDDTATAILKKKKKPNQLM